MVLRRLNLKLNQNHPSRHRRLAITIISLHPVQILSGLGHSTAHMTSLNIGPMISDRRIRLDRLSKPGHRSRLDRQIKLDRQTSRVLILAQIKSLTPDITVSLITTLLTTSAPTQLSQITATASNHRHTTSRTINRTISRTVSHTIPSPIPKIHPVLTILTALTVLTVRPVPTIPPPLIIHLALTVNLALMVNLMGIVSPALMVSQPSSTLSKMSSRPRSQVKI